MGIMISSSLEGFAGGSFTSMGVSSSGTKGGDPEIKRELICRYTEIRNKKVFKM